MTTLVGCDLDRTIIYSAGALLLDGPDEAAPPLVVTEVYQGAPLSYMTRAAEDLLADLAERARFVPVTTRTVAQYRRVRLPVPTAGYAITTNGAVILHDGEPDPEWDAGLRAEIAERCAPLHDVERLVHAVLPGPAVLRMRRAEELFAYAIVDRQELRSDDLPRLAAALTPLGWTVSLQGRKLYAVPMPIRKERALAEVARRLLATRTVAAGDSLLDRGMLDQADVAIRPAHGELEAAGWTAPHLRVTGTAGVRAGEEILHLAHAAVR